MFVFLIIFKIFVDFYEFLWYFYIYDEDGNRGGKILIKKF